MTKKDCVFCGRQGQSTAHVRAKWSFDDKAVDEMNTIDTCNWCHTLLDDRRTIALAPDMSSYLTLAADGSTVVCRPTERQPAIKTSFITWRNNYSIYFRALKECDYSPARMDETNPPHNRYDE